MAAFYFPKANLFFLKSPYDVSPQQLLSMATTKTSPVPQSNAHPVLSNSNAVIELSRASLRVSSTCGEDTSSNACGVVSVSLSSKEILLEEELGYKRGNGVC